MAGVICTLCLMPFIGASADKMHSKYAVPFAFFLRAVAALSFV